MGLETLSAMQVASAMTKNAAFKAELTSHEALEAARYGQQMLDHIAKSTGHWQYGRMTPDFVPGNGHIPGFQPQYERSDDCERAIAAGDEWKLEIRALRLIANQLMYSAAGRVVIVSSLVATTGSDLSSLPFTHYHGRFDFAGHSISIYATFMRSAPVLENLVVDISGMRTLVVEDVPYEMVGTQLRISDESLLPEAYTNMRPILEYDPDGNAIKLTARGYGSLTVTLWSLFFA
ncbi:hypothetical protein FOZ61_002553 [Perkinsus olseni]|uniref:Uncharacterized protein n=1 Tax=Perkinsus olseni TaxID=32597 RepID=A0A7J6LU69_PEROL|nr:hypothetical protein FOZ61_002553 [Perkinsus olseni]